MNNVTTRPKLNENTSFYVSITNDSFENTFKAVNERILINNYNRVSQKNFFYIYDQLKTLFKSYNKNEIHEDFSAYINISDTVSELCNNYTFKSYNKTKSINSYNIVSEENTFDKTNCEIEKRIKRLLQLSVEYGLNKDNVDMSEKT